MPDAETETMETGITLGERFVIESLLGVGGTSSVYRARDLRSQSEVAIKILSRDHVDSFEWRSRFEREARTCDQLRHPNVVRVYGTGSYDRRPFLVLELIDGEALSHWIAREAPLAAPLVIDVAQKICAALEHIHARGMVHRDIKPENVIIGPDGRLRIIDFGLAIRAAEHSAERLTASGSVVGTPEYLSPEQVFGRPVDASSDVFALGLVLYEMLTGELPFDGPSVEVARRNAFDDPPPMRERNNLVQVATELEALVFSMLDKDPGRRPAVAEVSRRLDEIAQLEAESTERPGRLALGAAAMICAIPALLALAT